MPPIKYSLLFILTLSTFKFPSKEMAELKMRESFCYRADKTGLTQNSKDKWPR